MISVTIIGGPHDGDEVTIEDAWGRVHVAIAGEPNNELWSAVDERTGISVHEVIMPVRLTRNGYRAYWSERDH